MAVDRLFKRRYRRFFDYALAKRFYQGQGFNNVYQYGPTPLLTLKKMVDTFKIERGQKLLDLGCGTGRHLFFLHHIYGIKCSGIEVVESFFRFSKPISRHLGVSIDCKNMLHSSLDGFDWILFFATSFDDDFIDSMIQKFLNSTKKLRIITTSFSLSEYNKNFETVCTTQVRYPWGKTMAYVNMQKK